MKHYFFISLLFLLCAVRLSAQEETVSESDSAEVFLIDYYITPEKPYKFILTFSTSVSCVSKVILQQKNEYVVSAAPSTMHKTEIDVSSLRFDSTTVPFQVVVRDSLGRTSSSEITEVYLPDEYKIEAQEASTSILFNCCIGGIIFGVPAPAYVSMDGKDYFSITKEIPLVSIYSEDHNYPLGYFAVDYQHVFNAPERNFFKFGYKHIFPTAGIEYISAGIKGISNFDGYNGIGAEISAGLFRFYNMFTVYTKYSYATKPGKWDNDFHTISIGLFASAFTLHLNL